MIKFGIGPLSIVGLLSVLAVGVVATPDPEQVALGSTIVVANDGACPVTVVAGVGGVSAVVGIVPPGGVMHYPVPTDPVLVGTRLTITTFDCEGVVATEVIVIADKDVL